MAKQRFFEYVGEPMLTRGDYGVNISGGHTGTGQQDSGLIYTFDPDFGDMGMISVESGLESGDWVEIDGEAHAAL